MKTDRIKMVKAMEYIVRRINNEEIVFNHWLLVGVADGDIEYGDLSDDAENVECYTNDEDFADLMAVFLRCMALANKDGGLYCDGIVSK